MKTYLLVFRHEESKVPLQKKTSVVHATGNLVFLNFAGNWTTFDREREVSLSLASGLCAPWPKFSNRVLKQIGVMQRAFLNVCWIWLVKIMVLWVPSLMTRCGVHHGYRAEDSWSCWVCSHGCMCMWPWGWVSANAVVGRGQNKAVMFGEGGNETWCLS